MVACKNSTVARWIRLASFQSPILQKGMADGIEQSAVMCDNPKALLFDEDVAEGSFQTFPKEILQ